MVVALHEFKDSYVFQDLDLEATSDLLHLFFGAEIYCKIMIIKTTNTTLYIELATMSQIFSEFYTYAVSLF